MEKTKKRGGRPAMVSGKRIHLIKAKLTDVEMIRLKSMQQESGLNRADFIRMSVLSRRTLTVNTTEIFSVFDSIGTELGRAGNNINQLARHANLLNRQQKLDPSIVISLNALLAEYTQIQGKLESALRQLLRQMKDR